MKKSITIIGINYFPEDSAIGLYTTQMTEYLAKNYDVSVITGFPYYPEWKIYDSYICKSNYVNETINSINLFRYKQYVPSHPTFKNRIVHLLDFTFGSIPNLFKIKKCDLVICIVPFTASIVLGLFLAKLRGAKVWVHIQDFEFDAAVESGLAGEESGLKSKIFNGLFWLEKKLLDKADIVSTISYGMLNKLESKTTKKSYFFPNWVDENFINPLICKPHAIMQSTKFKILYSGNIGAKQDWDFFLKIVDYFQENETIEFIVVGAGAKKEWLLEKTKNFLHVRHYQPIAFEELPDLLCSADLHILFAKNDVVDTVMPSKLLGMMASAKPSIVTGNLDSEVAKVFEKSGGGYFFDSENFEKVVKSIELLTFDQVRSDNIGNNARKYIIERFSSKKVLNDFEKKVKDLIF